MAQTAARRVTTKDASEKLAHRRMTVLELAERLGNVSEACRHGGIDRTSFYEWKRRFQLQGLDGLKDLPPVAKSHPMTTPPEIVARILELALQHPAYGCNRLEALLALEGRRVSAITIQKILNERELGSREQRWLALETKTAHEPIELTAEQVAFLEKLNPCFRERHVESGAPGELLSADTFMVGTLKGIVGSTCTPWSTPSAPTRSASCTSPSSPRPRSRCCTTTCYRSTPGSSCRSAPC
jgi:transposase-like protein